MRNPNFEKTLTTYQSDIKSIAVTPTTKVIILIMTDSTTTTIPTAEEQQKILIKNWETFKIQINKLTDKSDRLGIFLDAIEEEAMIAPASTRTDLVCSYVGGLIEHSLRVLSIAARLRKVYGYEKEITPGSLILVSLLHDN